MKALSDYLTNFSFGKGVHFQSPKAYQHIVPALLQKIWDQDNDKEQLLWQIGNQGSVSGDVFIKVAYDPGYTDPAGGIHPGRVRILPINSSFAFPEWHPHDRERLIRFKLKYRFWGTTADGTRQVFTYTEIITENTITEFVNDELVDERPNPLGVIPIVHIANIPAAGSPWGLADIADVVSLNREYNEKATDISDIVNYHANPVTVVVGAKSSELQKGANKVWAGLPKDSQVFNLEGGTNAIPHALEYLEKIKMAMHEMTGVPATALGEEQAISNTSGVALAIQYQPLMMKYGLKKLQYEKGLREISRLALMTLFLHEPDTLYYDPDSEGIWQEGMPLVVDPNDPLVYKISCEWPPPLPVDLLIKLQEIAAKVQLGLESKEGALRDLGEEFPDEKLEELFEEQVMDAKREGALQIIKTNIMAGIMAKTGITPEGEPLEETQPNPNGEGAPVTVQKDPTPMGGLDAMDMFDGVADPNKIMTEVVGMAYGAKATRRVLNPTDSNGND